jgi:hypothetical protein
MPFDQLSNILLVDGVFETVSRHDPRLEPEEPFGFPHQNLEQDLYQEPKHFIILARLGSLISRQTGKHILNHGQDADG